MAGPSAPAVPDAKPKQEAAKRMSWLGSGPWGVIIGGGRVLGREVVGGTALGCSHRLQEQTVLSWHLCRSVTEEMSESGRRGSLRA